MTSLLLTILGALALAVAPQDTASSAGRLAWVPNPTRVSRGWVSDPAHHLRPVTVQAIDSVIFALERETTAEMAVVVIDSLDGLTPADAALLLHRRWGVGKRDRNNGVLFLWSPALRQVYISVGYRLEGVLPDSRVGRIEDDVIIPQFKRNDFDAGVLAGVQTIANTVREEPVIATGAPAYHPPDAEGDARSPASGSRYLAPWWAIVAGIAAVLIGFIVSVLRWQRRRPRNCPKGHGRMQLLDETTDDARLSREEQLEEKLRSVDYDVWTCATCGETLVIPYDRWFSRFRKCAHCGRRTSSSTEHTIVPATRTSTGTAEVIVTCENCGARDVSRRILPMLPEPSSSSGGSSFSGGGGGGSSFGGGSAGGGGAGRSY